MKNISISILALLAIIASASSQELTPKEKAEAIAQNDFSKSKHEKKEKYGIVKEKHKVIESRPFFTKDLSLYEGITFTRS